MPQKHTWRCPHADCEQKEEQRDEHHKDAAPTHSHKIYDAELKRIVDVDVALEWVPPADWVMIPELGGWIPKPKNVAPQPDATA